MMFNFMISHVKRASATDVTSGSSENGDEQDMSVTEPEHDHCMQARHSKTKFNV